MPARERRYVLRSLFTPGSTKFWNLTSDHARMVYIALVVNADDNGRVECGVADILAMMARWNPVELIKPESNENQTSGASRGGFRGRYRELGEEFKRESTATAIQELSKAHLIRRYRADRKWYAEVNGFIQSQSGKEVKWEPTAAPAPPEGFAIHKHNPLVGKEVSNVSKEVGSSLVDAEKVFADARRKFRRIVGKNLGSLGTRANEWAGIVARDGAEMVLEGIAVWARENKLFLKESRFPIAHFLKNHVEWIEAARIDREPRAEEKTDDDSSDVTVEDIRPPGYVPPKKERVQ